MLWRASPCQAFFDEAVYLTGKSRQLVCQGLRPTTADTGLGRLRQMETKSVSVRLYTERACCGSPTRHSGSSSAFKYRLRPLLWHDHHSWSACGWKLILNPTSFLGVFWPRDGLGLSRPLVACRGWVCKGWNKIQLHMTNVISEESLCFLMWLQCLYYPYSLPQHMTFSDLQPIYSQNWNKSINTLSLVTLSATCLFIHVNWSNETGQIDFL